MKIEDDIKLDFDDVFIKPQKSTIRSRNDVHLTREYTFKHSGKSYYGIPIMAANMDTTGTFETAKVLNKLGLFTVIHKHYSVRDWLNFASLINYKLDNIAISAGMNDEDFNKLCNILEQINIEFICLDVANGYSQHFVNYVKKVRANFPNHIIIAGNVVTPEMVEELILAGADICKIGIGPGSVCTTRKQTGVGYPQLSAIIECVGAAHKLGGHIISDGGCTCPGHIAKAFGAGADFVMLGGMFAGHDESGGELVDRDGKKYKLFYGMSSTTAMNKHSGGLAEYRSSEGKTVEVPYRGKLEDTVKDILGGLRSACSYVGARTLKDLSRYTTFIRTTRQLNNMFG